MTIEQLLKKNGEALERIAISLEAIVESQGIVAGTRPPEPHDEQLDLDGMDEVETVRLELGEEELDEMDDPDLDDGLGLDEEEEEVVAGPPSIPSSRKKKTKKKVAKKKVKKTPQKKVIGKPSAEESEYTADEVRAKLKDLVNATGSAASAKSLLKTYGASTFGQLRKNKYDRIVADVDAQLE